MPIFTVFMLFTSYMQRFFMVNVSDDILKSKFNTTSLSYSESKLTCVLDIDREEEDSLVDHILNTMVVELPAGLVCVVQLPHLILDDGQGVTQLWGHCREMISFN